MAKRRQKTRTHVKADVEDVKKIPKSMVIRVGQTSMANHSLNQLVKDFRQIMQPHTAIKLKERKSNKLKDFVVMCGPLGVSHLFMFTQSEKTGNVSLKMARAPHGPTITYQVLDYSLGKDIKRFMKRPRSMGKEDAMNPPLLVLNGFGVKPPASGENDAESTSDAAERANVEKVVISMFQNIFPPLNPAKTQLGAINRVFMINKDPASGEVSMRHYVIDIREVDISRNLKRLYRSKNKLNKAVPNLHQKDDIASLILDHDVGAYTSESEADEEAIVKVMEKNQKSAKVAPASVPDAASGTGDAPERPEEPLDHSAPRKKAIKLTEVGPRLTLKLVKIEEGICSGKILHHNYVKKTSAEIKALEKKHAQRMKLKEERRKEQEANLSRKREVKDAKKQRKLERRKLREQEQEQEVAEGKEPTQKVDESSDSSSSEDENYDDVPEDLDSDLYSDVEMD
ncbi:LANO_0G06524g1_1 [Lachancea nothofagi CBS 11611]|uniref:LANO_0G06524g1_1 n=1 Tax=Lachancea nothofagi CBS 11611 TaxID=1266666 RepID=A0A1G4KH07_9SACH|nr:LANO_0G06524g1_1 [Lachancea nothofagi CBS 11611]